MTPRGTIHFFRNTKTGAFLLFLGLLGGGFLLVKGFASTGRNAQPAQPSALKGDEKPKPQVVETLSREMIAFNPPREIAVARPTPFPSQTQLKEGNKLPELAPISLYADTVVAESSTEPINGEYAPFGRLVQCELVITVDSSSIETPIVGLVTNDVWHNGHLIIPSGTEVHGRAQVDRVRERIASEGSWTLVWHNGEELTVSGIALDREKEQSGDGWGITDGSAGLRGQLLKSDDLAEIKLFAATFLSGAAGALTDKQQTLLGTQALPTLKNAPFAGAQEVLNVYAQQILSSIQRDGFYVRVPAGKQFYLYVTQTVDKSKAVIGGTRYSAFVTQQKEQNPNAADSLSEVRAQVQRRYAPVTINYSPLNPAAVNQPATTRDDVSASASSLPKKK